MKRDMDLLRSFLLKVEEQPGMDPSPPPKSPVTLKTNCIITRNWQRMLDSSKQILRSMVSLCSVSHTPDMSFLDMAREERLWKKLSRAC